MATFGAAFPCTQFRSERGVWMGGALLIVIALPQLAFGLMMTVGVPFAEEEPMPVIKRVDYAIGSAILIGCYVFAIYATIVNFRIFPPRWSIKSGGEPDDAPQSRSRSF